MCKSATVTAERENKMRLKRLFLCLIIAAAAVFSLAGCSDTSAEDAALNQRLIGGWVPLVDDYYSADENGNTLSFTVYEFTGTITKVHHISAEVIFSDLVNEYEITEGKFKVVFDGKAEFAKIDFTDNGNLLWYTDAETLEFRPVTDEEVQQFGIPLGQTLGFEPGASDTSVSTGYVESSDSAAE